eukprot:TRINITY_DN4221_c0_g1_i1.p1 TRINITY_DN4221_c0_g1~~TRINITY_DN4221_c0_g1_i1.p1  ORF type:complete len:467 (-),score=107.78 TRINITY_DN4221_c0_g1_i1:25-1425(-)
MDLKLLECIQFSLNHHLVSNAIFLAERLYAFHKNENTLNILAESYYRAGKIGKAYHLLVNAKDSSNKYLYAVCCYDLEKWGEGIQTLTNEITVPGGAAGLYLLGMLCKRSNQNALSTNYFQQALEKNPFLWCAFESLCSSTNNNLANEATLPSSKYYGEPNASQLNYLMEQSDILFSLHNVGSLTNSNISINTNTLNFNNNNNSNNTNSNHNTNSLNLSLNLSNLNNSANLNSPFTPVSSARSSRSEGNDSMDSESTDSFSTPVSNKEVSTPQTPSPSPLITKTLQAPKKKSVIDTKAPPAKIVRGSSFPSEIGSPAMTALPANTARRSTRLSDNDKAKKTMPAPPDKKRPNLTKIPISPSTPLPSNSNQLSIPINITQASNTTQTQTSITAQNTNLQPKFNNNIKEELGTPCLLALLSQIGYAYLLNQKYHCREAIKEFEALPFSQYNTSFIQDQIARSHYEVGE